MSTNGDSQLTAEQRELVTDIFRSDEATRGQPRLPPERVERAREYLSLLLVDDEVEIPHVELLEKLYQARFRYPSRHPLWSGEPLPPLEVASGFRHQRPLSEETARAVSERGPGGLTPEELAALLLNPYALWDLAERIDYWVPEYWKASLERNAQEVMECSGIVIPIPGLDDPLPPGR